MFRRRFIAFFLVIVNLVLLPFALSQFKAPIWLEPFVVPAIVVFTIVAVILEMLNRFGSSANDRPNLHQLSQPNHTESHRQVEPGRVHDHSLPPSINNHVTHLYQFAVQRLGAMSGGPLADLTDIRMRLAERAAGSSSPGTATAPLSPGTRRRAAARPMPRWPARA